MIGVILCCFAGSRRRRAATAFNIRHGGGALQRHSDMLSLWQCGLRPPHAAPPANEWTLPAHGRQSCRRRLRVSRGNSTLATAWPLLCRPMCERARESGRGGSVGRARGTTRDRQTNECGRPHVVGLAHGRRSSRRRAFSPEATTRWQRRHHSVVIHPLLPHARALDPHRARARPS